MMMEHRHAKSAFEPPEIFSILETYNSVVTTRERIPYQSWGSPTTFSTTPVLP